MKQKIEGILKEEEKKEIKTEMEEEIEEEELNSEDDVSGGLTRVRGRAGHRQEHSPSLLRKGWLISFQGKRIRGRFT